MSERRANIKLVGFDHLYLEREDYSFASEEERTSTVIELRADAKGGLFKTSTDKKNAEWYAPSGWKIKEFKNNILAEAGDRDQQVKQIGDTGISAEIWAKGHPKGEANNRSFIEISVEATIYKE